MKLEKSNLYREHNNAIEGILAMLEHRVATEKARYDRIKEREPSKASLDGVVAIEAALMDAEGIVRKSLNHSHIVRK